MRKFWPKLVVFSTRRLLKFRAITTLFHLRTNFGFKTRPDQFWHIFEPFSLVWNAFFNNFGLFSLKTTLFSLTCPIFNYFFGLRYYFETRLDGWLKVNVQSCFCIIYISLIIIRVQLEALKKSKNSQKLHFLVVNRPSLDQSLVFRSVLPSWMWKYTKIIPENQI